MRLVPLSVLVSAVNLHAQTWTQLPDFPGTARDDAASFTIGNKIYVGTGMDAGFQLTNDWWCFDRTLETWVPIAAMPTTPRQYCTGFTIADTGYVFGGVDANGALDQLWAYHPETDAWEQVASIPGEARYACAAVTGFYWNAIVAAGMLASGSPTNEAWKYHAQTDTWEPIAPVPGPPRHRAACFLGAGGMVIAGGADSSYTALNDVWSYPIWFETGQWYPEAALPSARFAADGSWGNAPTLIGGATGPGVSGAHTNAWRWDETEWHDLPPFAGGPRRGAVSASGPDSPWITTVYYGTGSDNIQRYRDWWKLEYAVGMASLDAPEVSLAPVPADASLQVSSAAPDGWSYWHIWSIDPRPMMQGALVGGSARIPTASLPTGTYVLRLTGLLGTAIKRFTVAH